MVKRTYIAVIEIEKPEGSGFHQAWVYEHSIEKAVQAISGHQVKVTASPVHGLRMLLHRLGIQW
jgi:hypothetical protein